MSQEEPLVQITRPVITIGWILAVLVLLLGVLGMLGVVPFTPISVFGLLVALAVARLV